MNKMVDTKTYHVMLSRGRFCPSLASSPSMLRLPTLAPRRIWSTLLNGGLFIGFESSSPPLGGPRTELSPLGRKSAKYRSTCPQDHRSANIALYFITGPCCVPTSGAPQDGVPQ